MQDHQKLLPLLMLSGGLLLLPFKAVPSDTAAQNITEARQETQIWTTYALSPYLRASDLKVSVKGGKATLTGELEDEVAKDLARQIALGVSGIKSVDNQIVVKADYVAPARTADRSFGEVIDDATTTATVKSKLLWSKHADGLATEVDTNRGKVTLKGTADSGAARDLAGRLAENTRGVEQVNNQLVVDKRAKAKSAKKSKDAKSAKNESARNQSNEARGDMPDGWITAKVKSTYLFSSNIDSADISVNTENGIVTLSGKVDSGAEHALAIEMAENIRGVKSVQSAQLTH